MTKPQSTPEHKHIEIDALHHHPKNAEFYGALDEVTEIVTEIKRHGFSSEKPLSVVPEPQDDRDWPANRIVSGHRRHQAAQEAGLETVPVRYTTFESEQAEIEYLLRENKYRQKTPGQQIQEGRWYEQQIREGAIESQGRVTDTVGTHIGISGRSYEKGRQVAEAAEEPDADLVAQEQWELLKAGEQSIHRAHTVLEADESDENAVQVAAEDDDGHEINDSDEESGTVAHSGVPYQLRLDGELADWAREIAQEDGEEAVRETLQREIL